MARRSYDRMYKMYEENNEEKETIAKVEEDSLPEVNIEAEKKTTSQTGKVIGGLNLNVRKQPKADGEVIDTVRDGATVIVTEVVNEEWYHITSPNGYVMKRYIQI